MINDTIEQETHHPNGALKSRIGYNGEMKRHGMCSWYNEDGRLTVACEYKDGKEDGRYWQWREDGIRMKMRGYFKDGLQDGLWEYRDEKGFPAGKAMYKDGKIVEEDER